MNLRDFVLSYLTTKKWARLFSVAKIFLEMFKILSFV
jgi:hypothetical protein